MSRARKPLVNASYTQPPAPEGATQWRRLNHQKLSLGKMSKLQ
jgi:hypothetical protein